MSGTMDKIKAKVDNVLHKDGSSNTNTGSDPTGPHDSRMANKADPRVDSDQYGAAGNTQSASYNTGATGMTGSTGTTGGMTGSNTNTYGTTGGAVSDPTGPHDSRLANKADPRVDSDRYGSAGNTSGASYNTGTTGMTGSTGTTGMTGTTGGMTGSNTNTYGTTGGAISDPTGPHDSRLANKADPRVDSDQYGGAGNTQSAGGVGGMTGTTGQHHGHHGHHHGHHGHHEHGQAGLAGQTGTIGSGNTTGTAGPHNSDMLNKLDPRVDSDLDGSKTVGGNKTYQ